MGFPVLGFWNRVLDILISILCFTGILEPMNPGIPWTMRSVE
jgi:hypothetical protein